MKRTRIADALAQAPDGQQMLIKGWVRTFRNNQFLALNDGSTIRNIQVVVDFQHTEEALLKRLTTGACVSALGYWQPSPAKGQAAELKATELMILGDSDAEVFPLQPKKHSLEFLREIAHLRFRTQTFSAIFRVRHALAYAIHSFFHQKGFYYIHTPIITGSDAEGAGEMFQVTTLPLNQVPINKETGKVDFQDDFFAKQTNLTVSGQLEAELAAMALGEVYTFGPTFRAENSNTSRHLAEFWMIEPEVAFNELDDNMDLAEDLLKYCIRFAMEHCADDLDFLEQRLLDEEKTKPQEERSSMKLIEKLRFVTDQPFARISYTEAIDILRNSNANKKGRFKYPVEKWGIDLQSEHERYLVEKHFQKPVILTDYPAQIKAFYMRMNEDGKTVRAMDILFPGIGEIVGGSQREERLEKLKQRMADMHVPEEELWWYLDTRRFGTCPHSGFGLGFERLIMFVTGMGNVRDVIPFPRTPKNAEF